MAHQLTGYRYEADPQLGTERGAFYVHPVSAIPVVKADITVGAVYSRTFDEITQGINPYSPVMPNPKRREAVYAFLRVKNLAGQPSEFPVGHAVGSHEKVGGRFKRRDVANIDSVFVRRSAEELTNGYLRDRGIGSALGYSLLGEFDPGQTATVMNMPEMTTSETLRAEDLLFALGFVARTDGKTSRNNSQNGQTWYEGPTVGELQEALISAGPWIDDRMPYKISNPNAPDPVITGQSGLRGFR